MYVRLCEAGDPRAVTSRDEWPLGGNAAPYAAARAPGELLVSSARRAFITSRPSRLRVFDSESRLKISGAGYR
ncbi:hypothetical protein EVAR_47793_1 [Eumeta japonica]|uniref:Uncharacterized protein n=1 Tax=Eumeta variegata TaxID=151549 RepID=A0A4C1Z733_EUMVA|nr:hypothetical protein EVAR_47793_1 [Eumeta japonica]